MPDLNRRRPSSAGRKPANFRSTWCCSFTVPPSSPDVRSTLSNPTATTKPLKKTQLNGSAAYRSPSPNRKFLDPRRILSPGRVSPIDSDIPLAPLPEIVGEVERVDRTVEIESLKKGRESEEVDEREIGEGLDLRVKVKGRDGREMVMDMDSRVLVENSLVLKRLVKKDGEIEVVDVEDVIAFKETIEMMYCGDLVGWLMKNGISKAIDVLEVSSKIMFDSGVTSCLNYIEAVPWTESEEEKLKNLFTRCKFDETVTQDILARLQPECHINSENIAVHLIQSIADGNNNSARKELQSLVNGLLSKSSVYQKDPAGLNSENLYNMCNSCLNSLMDLFKEESNREQISKQVENLNWLLEILIEKQMAEDFVCLWANQKELISAHQRASPMVRYELSRISASVFIALGKGKLRCNSGVRFSVLNSWFGAMMLDFGWLHRCSKGLDIRMLEEGLGQAVLTLPLKQQQSLFVEWFRCFGIKGNECPNLSRAFQVWWRRSFVTMGDVGS